MHETSHLHVDAILRADPLRWWLLELVSHLDLPDCWIAAGFIRNAVWDALHGRSPQPPLSDVDVIWFDPDRIEESHDRKIEKVLRAAAPSIDWSVKNQARMHSRNSDSPYRSATDAMRYWPETATAVAARRRGRTNSTSLAHLDWMISSTWCFVQHRGSPARSCRFIKKESNPRLGLQSGRSSNVRNLLAAKHRHQDEQGDVVGAKP